MMRCESDRTQLVRRPLPEPPLTVPQTSHRNFRMVLGFRVLESLTGAGLEGEVSKAPSGVFFSSPAGLDKLANL
jgi:hypothetical protein